MGFWGFFIILSLISYVVSITFRNKFKKYLQVPMQYGLTGRDVAMQMLADNGINDVRITVAQGYLSDHYNPSTKTIALSPAVYNGNSVASAAVAAHETGHALQHHTGYTWVKIRSGLVPVVQFGAQISSWVLLAGMFLLNVMPGLMLIGIAGYALTVLFSFVTLPVEFDASRRALKWLYGRGLVTDEYYSMAKDALRWAAMTYVVAALTALATLVYYLLIFFSASSDD